MTATPAPSGTSTPPQKAKATPAKAKATPKKAAPHPKATAAPPARKAPHVVTTQAEPEVEGTSEPAAAVEPKPAAVVPLRAVPAPPASAIPAPAEEKKPGVGALLLAAFRNGQSAVARAIGLVALIVAVVIIVGIALVLGGANPHNGLVKALYGLDGALVHPFAGDLHQPMTTAYIHNQQAVFGPKTIKKFVVENWGLATVVYLGAGLLLARLVRFGKA